MLSKAKAAVKSFRARRSFSTQSSSSDRSDNSNFRSVDGITSSIQLRTEKNEEDVTIVWLTKHAKNTIDQSIIETLRTINDYIQVRFK
jgi:hypothetical protein